MNRNIIWSLSSDGTVDFSNYQQFIASYYTGQAIN